MSRTPRNFYSARRDAARRCSSGSTFSGYRPSEEAEILPYQPHESLFDNPARRLDSVSDEDIDEGGGYDLQDENSRFSTMTTSVARAPHRAPLQSTTVHNQPTNGVFAMLQHQRELLQKVLSQQEEMKVQQSVLSQKLAKLEEDFRNSSSCSSSPTVSRKGKNRVTRDLTNKVAAVHDNLEEGFRLYESSTTSNNQEVKRKIIKEIIDIPGIEYSEEEIKAAIQRKYESLRRQWKLEEEKEDCAEFLQLSSRKKRYRQRRQRKFRNRSECVLKSEEKFWKVLTIEHMSEESDDAEDPNVIIVHQLPWRSQDLNKFLNKLDERYEAKVKKQGMLMAKKARKIGSFASSVPPLETPGWTIDKEWKKNNTTH